MGIGIWQVILILVVVLILFGAGKLPKVMGDVAKGVKNFKAGLREDEDAGEGGPAKVLGRDDATPTAPGAAAGVGGGAAPATGRADDGVRTG